MLKDSKKNCDNSKNKLIDESTTEMMIRCSPTYIQVGSAQPGAEVTASRPEVSVLLPDHLQHQLPGGLQEVEEVNNEEEE